MPVYHLLTPLLPTSLQETSEDRGRTLVLAGFLLLAGILSSTMFLFRLLDAGWTAATIITLFACFAYIALLVAFRLDVAQSLISDCALLLLLIVIVSVASRDNGLYSRVMIWLPAAPLIANFFAGRIRAISTSLLVIVLLFGLALAHHNGLLPSYPLLGSEWARFVAYSASTVLVSVTAYLYERNRREADAEKQKLAALHRQWVSVVSHELRTPLTALHGALSLASQNTKASAGNNTPLLTIALRNTERLVRLTNELLDMERINTGSLNLIRRPSDITQLLENAADTYRHLADERHITLAIESAVTRDINLDADRIEQVVHNFLSNAIKFSKSDSSICLRAVLENEHLHVEVTDTGPGIAPELASRLFTPFGQGDAKDNRTHGGFGLGLSICHALVTAHGGKIGYRNGSIAGCTFYFDIPVGEA